MDIANPEKTVLVIPKKEQFANLKEEKTSVIEKMDLGELKAFYKKCNYCVNPSITDFNKISPEIAEVLKKILIVFGNEIRTVRRCHERTVLNKDEKISLKVASDRCYDCYKRLKMFFEFSPMVFANSIENIASRTYKMVTSANVTDGKHIQYFTPQQLLNSVIEQAVREQTFIDQFENKADAYKAMKSLQAENEKPKIEKKAKKAKVAELPKINSESAE